MILLLVGTASAATPFQDHMQGHFTSATDALLYTTMGDLAKAQEEAAKLDHDSHETVSPDLEGYVTAMRTAARAVAATTDVQGAATAVAELGTTCAACHTHSKNGPALEEKDLEFPHMAELEEADRHGWAPYLLWIGTVVPDDRAWTLGVGQLVAPAAPDGKPEAAVAALATFTANAERAREAKDTPARAAAMAALIGSCHGCHTVMGVE